MHLMACIAGVVIWEVVEEDGVRIGAQVLPLRIDHLAPSGEKALSKEL